MAEFGEHKTELGLGLGYSVSVHRYFWLISRGKCGEPRST
jgi:hypothetical protein